VCGGGLCHKEGGESSDDSRCRELQTGGSVEGAGGGEGGGKW
jgi:hypothetical protein